MGKFVICHDIQSIIALGALTVILVIGTSDGDQKVTRICLWNFRPVCMMPWWHLMFEMPLSPVESEVTDLALLDCCFL